MKRIINNVKHVPDEIISTLNYDDIIQVFKNKKVFWVKIENVIYSKDKQKVAFKGIIVSDQKREKTTVFPDDILNYDYYENYIECEQDDTFSK